MARPYAFILAILTLVAATACERSEAHERPHTWADTVKGGVLPSGASRVAVITDLHQPETVIYDPDQDCYFISNMLGYGSAKDNQGYILRVEASDITKQTIFAQSGANGVQLDAPKGMTLQGDTLWTADIDKVRGFDRHTGAPVATVDLAPQHAVLLNSIATAPDGTMRVTDTGIDMSPDGVLYVTGDKIFEIDPHRNARIVAQGPQLAKPNGIVWDPRGKRWVVVGFTMFDSYVYAMKPADTAMTRLANGPGQFDGVDLEKDGTILFTSWADSSVWALDGSTKKQMVRYVPSPAGIGIDRTRNRLLIPMPTQDKVAIWSLPRP